MTLKNKLFSDTRERTFCELQENRVRSVEDLVSLLKKTEDLSFVTFENVDMSGFDDQLKKCDVAGTLLLGCTLSEQLLVYFHQAGATILPSLGHQPYNPYRSKLYDAKELYDKFDPEEPSSYANTTDGLIYANWKSTGQAHPVKALDAIAQRIHDHSIRLAMEEFLFCTCAQPVVAIMAGHAMKRSSDDFKTIALLSKKLSELGYLMVSGGGPGGMEATHLGAWFNGRSESEINEAISFLANKAEVFSDPFWLSSAFQVIEKYPRLQETAVSLGIPTWLYGHEPSTPFATHIAKYFANSLREDGLVTVARAGIVYAPGSAGTVQEIFDDAVQNHYLFDNTASPMLLFGKEYWTDVLPVNQLLTKLAQGHEYESLIGLVDTVDEAAEFISTHPPFVKM